MLGHQLIYSCLVGPDGQISAPRQVQEQISRHSLIFKTRKEYHSMHIDGQGLECWDHMLNITLRGGKAVFLGGLVVVVYGWEPSKLAVVSVWENVCECLRLIRSPSFTW